MCCRFVVGVFWAPLQVVLLFVHFVCTVATSTCKLGLFAAREVLWVGWKNPLKNAF